MKTIISKSSFLLIAFFCTLAGYAQSWIPIGNSNKEVCVTEEVIESNSSIYKSKITINGFFDEVVTINGEQYHMISFDEGSFLYNVGEPQLPIISYLFATPSGAICNATISEVEWDDINLGKIYPAQKQCLESDPLPVFTINENIYRSNLFSHPLVIEGQEQTWRNIRNKSIEICPFKYYPSNNKLDVLKEFILEISFDENVDVRTIDKNSVNKAVQWNMFKNLSKQDFIGMENNKNMMKSNSSNDYDYLVIVGNINEIITEENTLNRFLMWKAFKGLKTKMVTTSETGTTPNSIKSYISTEYANHHIQYVLFIGDHNTIPASQVTTPKNRSVYSDYWYGCLDGTGDYEAEVPVGRMPINSLSQFRNIVNKTISYEKNYQGDYRKILLIANYQDAPQKYQGCCEDIRTNTYTVPLLFTTAYGASLSLGGDEATNAQVKNHINNEMHIVNYRGHGDTNLWWNWNILGQNFTNSDVDDIHTCSIYFNICCSNGQISTDPCMMEKLLRSEVAATACLAATEPSYTYPNHEFDRKLFTKLFNNNVWFLGDLDVQAHIATFTSGMFDTARDNAYVYLCGGDPALEIWTAEPQIFEDVELDTSGSYYTLNTMCSNYTLSVVSENGVLLDKYISGSTSCVFTPPSGNYYIVLNKHNYYPYIIYCSDSEYIQNESIEVNSVYVRTPLNIGYDVTTAKPFGNVFVRSGAKLSIHKGNGSVTIKNGFECENGAEFIIK